MDHTVATHIDLDSPAPSSRALLPTADQLKELDEAIAASLLVLDDDLAFQSTGVFSRAAS